MATDSLMTAAAAAEDDRFAAADNTLNALKVLKNTVVGDPRAKKRVVDAEAMPR